MANRIQLRRDTAARWASINPVLAQGEPGIETDTGKQKFGDGSTSWTALPYASAGPAGPIGPAGVADDTSVKALVQNPASQTTTALSASYLGRAGTKTDTSAGLFDWQNNAASGYLFHLRTGVSSTGGSAAIGIGTDLGAGNGILISHKNTGKGILATGQPGSGLIAEFTSRGPGSGFWTNVQAGGGSFQINARDGQGYADGASTSGSTTFTSATASFTAGDVGKTIAQLTSKGTTDPFGSIPSGTTIASVTNSTTVELSQAATATGTAVLFSIAGRIPALAQALFRVMDTDLLTEILKFTRGGAVFGAADVASVPVRVNAKAGQTGDLFQTYDGAGTKAFFVGSNGGTTALSRFNKDGYFMTTKSAAPADADINTGELALWVDTTAGAAKFMIKAKDSAGAVKTGSVTLA